MAIQSKGRGTAAAFGLLLLLAGVVGAIVLYVLSERRPGEAIDEFARAPVGCTTTLEFTETGTFFVYEETGATVSPPGGGCVPVADPGARFGFELAREGTAVIPRRDDSIAYERDGRSGASVARFGIDEPGEYEIVVRGRDSGVVAAVGRDPDAGVDDLRRGAVAVLVAGVVLGALLLILAGRRSKRAATYTAPEGPGWRAGATTPTPPSWPPEPPSLDQVPLHPQQPPEPVEADALPARLDRRTPPSPAPWAPPSAADRAIDAPPPPDPTTGAPPPLPPLRPTLPERRRDDD